METKVDTFQEASLSSRVQINNYYDNIQSAKYILFRID